MRGTVLEHHGHTERILRSMFVLITAFSLCLGTSTLVAFAEASDDAEASAQSADTPSLGVTAQTDPAEGVGDGSSVSTSTGQTGEDRTSSSSTSGSRSSSGMGSGSTVAPGSGSAAASGSNTSVGSASASSSTSGSAAGSGTVQATQTIPDGNYSVEDVGAPGMLMGVRRGSASEGATMQIAGSDQTASQCFTFTHIADGYYSIVSYASGLALTVSGNSVVQSSWSGSDAQLWAVVDTGAGTFNIVSKDGGVYLDVTGAKAAAGTAVGVWTATGGSNQAFTPQSFTPEHTIADGTYTIGTAMDATMTVDIAYCSSEDGAPAWLWHRNGTSSQVFSVTYEGNGYYTISDVASGRCLDVSGASTVPGTSVIQYTPLGSTNQQWAITSAGGGTYTITSRTSDVVLDVAGGVSAAGATMCIWTPDSGDNQRFTFTAATAATGTLSDGIYTIASALDSDEVIDVPGDSHEDGTQVDLWTANGGNNQKFEVTRLDASCYMIQTVSSDKSLDVAGGGTADGTSVIQYRHNGGMNQRWVIVDSGITDGSGNHLYSVTSAANGLALTVAGGAAVDQAAVVVDTADGSNAQLFTFASTTPGPSIVDGTYTISSVADSNMAVDVAGASSADGANIDIYDYNYARNQRFAITYVSDGNYQIASVSSGLVLSETGTGAGANVVQSTPTGSANQLWRIYGSANGSYTFKNVESGLYLDITGGAAVAGANVEVWTATGGSNQSFYLGGPRSLADGTYTITSALNASFSLDISGGSTAHGANVELYSYNGGTNQQYKITALGGGYYKVVAWNSGDALDVAGAGTADGTNVLQWKPTGASNQQWLIKDDGDGYYSFVSACNGLYLDVAGGSAVNGANIDVSSSTGELSQRFQLTKVADPKVSVDFTGCYIMINKQCNTVTVYLADGTPYKAMICSCGYPTPLGTYYSPAKYRYHGMVGGSVAQYCTRIVNGFLLHSVPQLSTYGGSVYVRYYNLLGTTQSLGCVRLTVADAKWIYDHCDSGVRITIYNSSDPGPLGKPSLTTIDVGASYYWDPTDPDPNNPYNN